MRAGRLTVSAALAFALAMPASTQADEGQANALFVEAVQAWQKAEALTDGDPASIGQRVDLLEKVNENLNDIVRQHPDASPAVQLVIGEAVGPLSLATVEEALEVARSAVAQQDELCFAHPTTACLLDILARDPAGFARSKIATLFASTGRMDEALTLLDSPHQVVQFLDEMPPDAISEDILNILAERLRATSDEIYSALAVSRLARAAAEQHPSSDLASRLLTEALPLVAGSRDEERVKSLVHLSAAQRALGDAGEAARNLHAAKNEAQEIRSMFRWDIVTLLAREHILIGQPRAGLDIIKDLIEPDDRSLVFYRVLPDFIEAGALDALVEAAADLDEDTGVGVLSSALGQLAEVGRIEEAMAQLKKAPAGQQSRLRLAIASGQVRRGDVAGATATLSGLSAEDLTDPKLAPSLAGALTRLAAAQWANGEGNAARGSMERAAALLEHLADPQARYFVLQSLATGEAKSGNPDQAHRYTDQALEAATAANVTDPDAQIRWAVARAFAEGRRGAEAVDVARAIEDERWRQSALLDIARVLWEAEAR